MKAGVVLKIFESGKMRKRNDFVKLFESRKSNIDSRIRRDYIENVIATVNCCISGYSELGEGWPSIRNDKQ